MGTAFQLILDYNFHTVAEHNLCCKYHIQLLSILNLHLQLFYNQFPISSVWPCWQETYISYWCFHGTHIYSLSGAAYLLESSTMALTEKIYFFQWDDLDPFQDIFCEHWKCHQARVIFFFSPWYHYHVWLKSRLLYLGSFLKWNHPGKSWQQAPQSLEKVLWGTILCSVTETFFFLTKWLEKASDYLYSHGWCIWKSFVKFFSSFSFCLSVLKADCPSLTFRTVCFSL